MSSRSRYFIVSALAAFLAAASAQAQKPVLTRSVDEPGRTPYFSQTFDACIGDGCTVSFTQVPAGFRLVVTHAAVIYSASSTTGSRYAVLTNGTILNILYLPAPAPVGANNFIVSTPVICYVEPGITPQMSLAGLATGDAIAMIAGYLIAIPRGARRVVDLPRQHLPSP